MGGTVIEIKPENVTKYKISGLTSTDVKQYHDDKSASYVLPNDTYENDRLVLQHNLLFNLLKGHFLAPIEQSLNVGITVLDSGCGPGDWMADMANAYPKSTFHGVDISDTVPERSKLKNTIYSVGNIVKEPPCEDNFFDYIHQRLLVAGFTRDDWVNAMKNFYRALKPGGYAEFVEVQVNGYKNPGPLLKEVTDTFHDMLVDANLVPTIKDELKDMMVEAGFTNITVVYKYHSLSGHTNEGKMQWKNLYRLFEGVGASLVEYNDNWKDLSDFNDHMTRMREEIVETKDIHQYAIVYGQKPLE